MTLAGTQSADGRRRSGRLPWDLAEIVGVGTLVATVALGVFSVAAGIAYGFTSVNESSSPVGDGGQAGPSVVEMIQRCTAWASPIVAALALASLVALWWEIAGPSSPTRRNEADVDAGARDVAAQGHRLRARGLILAAMAFLTVVVVASLANMASAFDLNTGYPSQIVVSGDLAVVGE